MKKCRQCTNPATRHITEIDDGEVQELHLCETCTKQYLSNLSPSKPDAEEVSQQMVALTSDQDLEELDQISCPNCGITFKEFRRQGRLGCPHDYIVFKKELEPLLENIHGETEHAGKCPKRAPNATRNQSQIIRLRNQLKQAVESEDYEHAAELRDQIEALEETTTPPGASTP